MKKVPPPISMMLLVILGIFFYHSQLLSAFDTNLIMHDVLAAEAKGIPLAERSLDFMLMSRGSDRAKGHAFLLGNRVEEAVPLLRSAYTQAPADIVAAMLVARAELIRGQEDAAIAVWRDVDAANYWAWKSLAAVDAGDIDTATLLADRSHAIDSQAPEAHYTLGQVFYQQQTWVEAARMLTVAIEHADAKAAWIYDAHMLRGQTYMNISGEGERSLVDFHAAAAMRPNDPWPYIRMCSSYIGLERADDAVEACLKGVALQSNLSFAHYYLGRAYYQEMDWTSAQAEFRKALELDPTLQAAQVWLAKTNEKL